MEGFKDVNSISPLKGIFMDMGIATDGTRNYIPWLAYDKDEADRLIARKDTEIASLKARLAEVVKMNSKAIEERNRLASVNAELNGRVPKAYLQGDTPSDGEKIVVIFKDGMAVGDIAMTHRINTILEDALCWFKVDDLVKLSTFPGGK